MTSNKPLTGKETKMEITRTTFEQLTAAVTEYLSSLKTSDRVCIVAWMYPSTGRVEVARSFPNWRNGFDGPMAVTSCRNTSPVGNVVSRIMSDFED